MSSWLVLSFGSEKITRSMNDEVTVIGRLCAARLCSAIRNSRLFRWRFLLNDVGVFSYIYTISRVGVWSAGSTPRVGLGALAGADAIFLVHTRNGSNVSYRLVRGRSIAFW